MNDMDYWQKQTKTQALFPDIIWSRPESLTHKGKLLIIGGNLHGFSSVASAYDQAKLSGAGHIKVLLPECLRKTFSGVLDNAEFASCTPSGSFSQKALGEFLIYSDWADGVLLVGDLGRNSETTILLEKYVSKYTGFLTITRDSADYFMPMSEAIINRLNTTLVINLSQLQKLARELKFDTPFLLGMGVVMLAQALHKFTKTYPVNIVTKELNNIVVASQGRVSSTKLDEDKEFWRAEIATKNTVFWIQNTSKPFEAITSSLI